MKEPTKAYDNGWYVVQNGSEFFTALQLACKDDDGRELNHLLIISGPFPSYELADKKRNGENV